MIEGINTLLDISNERQQKIFIKYGIEVPDNYLFSDINLVIGINGAGKTRFLNAIREIYEVEGKNKIMYGYFPDLRVNKANVTKSKELPAYTLYESLQEGEVEFRDFLKEIENQNEEYIPQLLNYHSNLQKKRSEKTIQTLFETFEMISGKQLLLDEEKIYINNMNGKVILLEEAMTLFSPGELMIFYIAVFLSLQKNSNIKRTIILDEPECHLHPNALLTFMKLIKQSSYFDSIWIATHSLFLIPEFQFENINFIENSKLISRSSKTYLDILNSMLGEDRKKTTQFLSSLSQWQYCGFMCECFENPEVIDVVNPYDEQIKLFIEYIENHKTINVLDFGGGSARLGKSIKLSRSNKAQQIHYEIYDPKPKYMGNEFTVYKEISKINKKYDCIVLMNVLHEIEPNRWPQLFQNIYAIMEKDSYLLFVETAWLNKGEMPNADGYFILDNEDLAILFSVKKPFDILRIKENQKSVCVPIPQSCIKNITMESVNNTIKSLEKKTFNKIKTLKNSNKNNARYYAFLTQLYINAKLYTNSLLAEKKEISELPQIKEFVLPRGQERRVLINKLVRRLSKIENEQNEKVCKTIKLNVFFPHTGISKEVKQVCWKEILYLEKMHEKKENLAIFLLGIALMGDDRGMKRLENNGYLKYIKDIIS